MATFDKLDRPRQVLFDIKAIRTAEQTLGVGIHKAITDGMGPLTTVTILWAGLSRKNRNLSYEDVEELVQKSIDDKKLTMRQLIRYIRDELIKSAVFSDDEDDEEEDVPLATPDSSESN